MFLKEKPRNKYLRALLIISFDTFCMITIWYLLENTYLGTRIDSLFNFIENLILNAI